MAASGEAWAKWHILRHYFAIRRRRFESRAALEAWQQQRVVAFLRQILPKSEYYRNRFGDLPLESWRQLVPIGKSEMVSHFDALNTVGLTWEETLRVAMEGERTRDFSTTVRGVTVGLSSGTSGARGVFIASREERWLWAGAALAKMLPGSLLERNSVAFFLRANSNVYESVRGRRLQFEFFDLLESIPAHVARLNVYRPSLLVAPATVLRILADERKAGRLEIAPRKIISVAEVLDPLDARLIAEAFDQRVHQAYQCTEGFLGVTCPEGTLHLNEDLAVIEREPLPGAADKFVPIVTDFHRVSQPIIRYRLNDILTERATPCPCGSHFLALDRIEGRCDDLLHWPSSRGAGPVPVFPDFITRAILAASSEIEEYWVVAPSPGSLEVALRVKAAARDDAQRSVRQAMEALAQRMGCEPPVVRYVDPADRQDLTRKLRRVERRY